MDLVRFAFNGGIPPACRPWFLGGRLIALRKDGDSPALRKIRPIAIGSVLGRVVSKCAAAGSTVRFATLFHPPRRGRAPQDHGHRPTGHLGPSR